MTLPNLSEVLIILFVMLLVFGAGQLKRLGEALSKLSGPDSSVENTEEDVKE
jgi:Sec-independent protein translocase protein TatA